MAEKMLKAEVCENHLSLGRHGKACNILKMFENHVHGFLKTEAFKFEVMKLKIEQLKPSPELFEIDSDISHCKFLRTTDTGCIIGIWQKDMDPASKHSSVYHLRFEYNQQHYCVEKTESCPIVSEISCCGPFFKRIDVTDSCEKNIGGRNLLLSVGNTAVSGGRIVLNVTDDDSQPDEIPEIIWRSRKCVWSCASNAFSEYYAAGTEKGCFLFDTLNFREIKHLPGSVLSVEFGKNGNLLYCGTEIDELFYYDLREALWQTEDMQLGTCLGLKGVKEMKLLSDDVSMIATVIDGKVCKMDLRMQRPVFQYPNFINKHGRRPLSIDEGLDLLCATGDDNCTRIWSLSSGKLLRSIQPLHHRTRSHACLIAKQRRWFVAMVQDNILTPIIHS